MKKAAPVHKRHEIPSWATVPRLRQSNAAFSGWQAQFPGISPSQVKRPPISLMLLPFLKAREPSLDFGCPARQSGAAPDERQRAASFGSSLGALGVLRLDPKLAERCLSSGAAP